MVKNVTNRAASTYENKLIIAMTDSTDISGTYLCTVKNPLGESSMSITVAGKSLAEEMITY